MLADAAREVHALYPGTEAEPTRLNFVLTGGETPAATRWGHTLHLLDQARPGAFEPVADGLPVRVVAVASEPLTPDGWRPLDDRTLIVVRPDLSWTVDPVG